MSQPSAMAQETAESAVAVAGLMARRAEIAALARRIDVERAPLAVVCGRGSSGHAGVHLRYLIETRLRLACSATAPSVTTALKQPLRLRDALFVVLSQSGASPDLVAAARMASEVGAQTVAIVNVEDLPVARACRHVLPIRAGPERSVAATKSVIASMAAASALIADLAGDAALDAALMRLPDRLAQALTLDWTTQTAPLAAAPCLFVSARGFGLGPAREIALKVAETLQTPALAYSAAELRHGPRASVSASTPVLALRLGDETAKTVDGLVRDLRRDGVPVAVCGGPDGDLPWIGDDHAAVDAIAMLAPAYRLIEATARAKGLDPDRPPFLRKVTETL